MTNLPYHVSPHIPRQLYYWKKFPCTILYLKKLYLKEFKKFKEEKDSIAYQRLICKPKNIKLVDSVELKESIYQRLWESNRTHKGLFTRFWNKEWAKKLSQAQPV